MTPRPQNSCSMFRLIVLDGPPHGTPTNIRIGLYFIFLETGITYLHFAADSMDRMDSFKIWNNSYCVVPLLWDRLCVISLCVCPCSHGRNF